MHSISILCSIKEEKESPMRKRRTIAAMLILTISMLSGCNGALEENQEQTRRETTKETVQQNTAVLENGFYAMAEEFEVIYRPCDQMAAAYNRALVILQDYMEDRSEEAREETLNQIKEIKEVIESQEIPDYTMSEEVKGFLEKRGIPETEFLAVAEQSTVNQQQYLQHMETYEQNLEEFIVTVGVIPMSLKLTVDYQAQMQECDCIWMSYAANEVFLSLKQEEIDYMKENVFSKWEFYYPEDIVWQDKASYALQKQEEYWNKEMELLNQMTAAVGELVNQEYAQEYGYVVDIDANVMIIRYVGEDTKTEIPEVIQNYPVTTIRHGAFGGTNVKEVTIPNTVKLFGTDIFPQCPDVTIYGEKGSAAEKYAELEGIPFKVKEK